MILVFDLDDTLYDERTFVMSGFAAVAQVLSPISGRSESALVERMVEIMERSGRGLIFNYLLEELSIDDEFLVTACVKAYREHEPRISLPTAHRRVLERLQGFPKYVVTDGNPGVQERKVRALGLESIFKEFFYTWAFGEQAAKPSLQCFHMICEKEQAPLSEIVYIGDDPSKDFVALKRAGAHTIRVRTGRFSELTAASEYEAALQINRLVDLPRALGLPSEEGTG
jgi:putative hydrolase of the HAD superfamily